MEKPGVLFLINEFRLGGAEVFLLRLARALQSDYRIFVLDRRPHVAEPDFKAQFLKAGVGFIEEQSELPESVNRLFWKINALGSYIGIRDLHRRLKLSWQKKQLLKNLRKHKIRLLHSHSYSADVLAFELQKKTQLPWIITMHGDYNLANVDTLPEDIKQAVRSDLTSFLSSVSVLTYVGAPNIAILPSLSVQRLPPCQQISLGLEPVPTFQRATDIPFTFCMVARATASKGWEVAVAAFEKVHARFPQTRLLLVGPLEDALGPLHTTHGNHPAIHFTGMVNDTSPWLKESHVGLLPSWFPSESTPYSLIEYLAHGLPVIVTKHGDMPDMIRAGTKECAGLLITDAPNEVPDVDRCAQAMITLMEDTSLYESMAHYALEAFVPFSMAHCGNAYKTLYKRFIS